MPVVNLIALSEQHFLAGQRELEQGHVEGARLEFDKENRLYITSGDRNWGEKSQDPQSHIGKIVRVNDDGSVPKDNPFVGKKDYLPEIYTMGHRNQTGLRFDPATDVLWSTEFGPAGGQEQRTTCGLWWRRAVRASCCRTVAGKEALPLQL